MGFWNLYINDIHLLNETYENSHYFTRRKIFLNKLEKLYNKFIFQIKSTPKNQSNPIPHKEIIL